MLHLDANTNYKNEQHLDTRSRCCIQMLHPYIASNTKTDMALDVRFLIVMLQFSPCVDYMFIMLNFRKDWLMIAYFEAC